MVLAAQRARHVLECVKHSTAEGGACPTLLCTGAAPPRVLCAVLGTLTYGGRQTVRLCSKEGDEDAERP